MVMIYGPVQSRIRISATNGFNYEACINYDPVPPKEKKMFFKRQMFVFTAIIFMDLLDLYDDVCKLNQIIFLH